MMMLIVDCYHFVFALDSKLFHQIPNSDLWWSLSTITTALNIITIIINSSIIIRFCIFVGLQTIFPTSFQIWKLTFEKTPNFFYLQCSFWKCSRLIRLSPWWGKLFSSSRASNWDQLGRSQICDCKDSADGVRGLFSQEFQKNHQISIHLFAKICSVQSSVYSFQTYNNISWCNVMVEKVENFWKL